MNSFKQISIKELPTWIRVFIADGMTDKKEMLDELNLIDDLLVLQKSQCLLNRKRNLKAQLEARIGKELNHKTVNLNVHDNRIHP